MENRNGSDGNTEQEYEEISLKIGPEPRPSQSHPYGSFSVTAPLKPRPGCGPAAIWLFWHKGTGSRHGGKVGLLFYLELQSAVLSAVLSLTGLAIKYGTPGTVFARCVVIPASDGECGRRLPVYPTEPAAHRFISAFTRLRRSSVRNIQSVMGCSDGLRLWDYH